MANVSESTITAQGLVGYSIIPKVAVLFLPGSCVSFAQGLETLALITANYSLCLSLKESSSTGGRSTMHVNVGVTSGSNYYVSST